MNDLWLQGVGWGIVLVGAVVLLIMLWAYRTPRTAADLYDELVAEAQKQQDKEEEQVVEGSLKEHADEDSSR